MLYLQICVITLTKQCRLRCALKDPDGFGCLGGVQESPLRQNYFIFMENFQKNQEKLTNNQVKIVNQIPLCKFDPLSRTTGSAPVWHLIWACTICLRENFNILFKCGT